MENRNVQKHTILRTQTFLTGSTDSHCIGSIMYPTRQAKAAGSENGRNKLKVENAPNALRHGC